MTRQQPGFDRARERLRRGPDDHAYLLYRKFNSLVTSGVAAMAIFLLLLGVTAAVVFSWTRRAAREARDLREELAVVRKQVDVLADQVARLREQSAARDVPDTGGGRRAGVDAARATLTELIVPDIDRPQPAAEQPADAARLRTALDRLNEARRKDASVIDAPTALTAATAESALGKQELALEWVNLVLSRRGDDHTGWLVKGVIYMRRRAPAAALESFQRALELNEGFARAYYHKGRALLELKRTPEALTAFQRAAEIDAAFTAAHMAAGQVLYRQNQLTEAERAFEAAIKADGQDPAAHHWLGMTLLLQQRYKEAARRLARAATLDPRQPDHKFAYAVALHGDQDYAKALEAYNEVLALDDTHAAAWKAKARLLLRLEKPREALTAVGRALAIEGDDEEAWYTKGGAHLVLNEHEQAAQAFERATAIRDDFAEAWYQRARVFSLQEKRDQMLTALRRAAGIDQFISARARDDTAFKRFRDDPEFKALIQ